jgi:hypothetical protein
VAGSNNTAPSKHGPPFAPIASANSGQTAQRPLRSNVLVWLSGRIAPQTSVDAVSPLGNNGVPLNHALRAYQ